MGHSTLYSFWSNDEEPKVAAMAAAVTAASMPLDTTLEAEECSTWKATADRRTKFQIQINDTEISKGRW